MLAGQGGRESERHAARAKRAERGLQDRKTVEGMVGVLAGGGRGRVGRGSGDEDEDEGEEERGEGKKGTSPSEWMRYAVEIVRNARGYLA